MLILYNVNCEDRTLAGAWPENWNIYEYRDVLSMDAMNQYRNAKGKRKSYLLRINEDLWNELNVWAGQEFRSVNSQIELILQRSVDERSRRLREDAGER